MHVGEASGELAGNLHFGGFKPPIAHAQAFGQAVAQGFPIAETAGGDQQDH